jgi:hypothetical protein
MKNEKQNQSLLTGTSGCLLAATLMMALLALCLTPSKGHAQGQYTIVTLTGTNNMPANTTNTLALPANFAGVTKHEEVAVLITFNSLAADTANKWFFFKTGLDTNNLQTVNQLAIPIAANGTTKVVFTTNIYLGTIGYFALDSIGNQSATVAASNIVVKVATKPKFRN